MEPLVNSGISSGSGEWFILIPQGRKVCTEAEVAEAMGLPLHTWRRRVRARLEERVQRVNEGEGRVRLYDAEQVRAYVEGVPVPPAARSGEEHPDDLLTDKEAGALLGVDASTVRAYAVSGYLPRGVEVHGRRWTRREILERVRQGDQRHFAARTGAGRPKSSPERPNRGRAGRDVAAVPDARVVEVGSLVDRAEREGLRPPTAAVVAERFGVSRTTGARILAAARSRVRDASKS
ncbi:hypothetical protein [Streptomyces sp. NPDC047130]|uniref:hypothetical protein n=1 Tax=Streptomyces sp. NPDC047130 TaxID=3155261 RepID=UPI0033D73C7A